MKVHIRHYRNINYLQFILLAWASFLIPVYICDTNRHNLLFAMAEIPLIILLFQNLKKKSKERNKIYLIMIFLYFGVFLYYDIVYLKCHWALFYKIASFLVLWDLDACESYFTGDTNSFFTELTDTILSIFSFTVILSLIANVIGVDAIFLDLDAFHIRRARAGIFLDKRLTWVFMHKSTYGLLLVLALALLIKRKDFPLHKLWVCLYFIAAIRINSMVSLVSMCGVLFAYYMETKEISRKTMLKIFFAFFIGVILAAIGYYIVALKRNVSNLGDRAYIWAIYADALAKYPHGMGKSFFTGTFWLAAGGRYINNFHSVILNEIIHYSVPVGILFVVLVMYYPIRYISANPAKLKNIILLGSISLPMLFDQALNDLIFPIFLIMLRLCFSSANEIETHSLSQGSAEGKE